MMPARAVRLLALFLVTVCTVGCDQATKHLARTELGKMNPGAVSGRLLEFSLAENPGAFLSLGATLPQAVRTGIFTAGVALGLVFLLVYLVRTPRLAWLPWLGLALIGAGGLSNLADRLVRHGLVTDFMTIRLGPLHTGVFNLADLAVVAGLLILVASRWRGKKASADSGR
jgi:signal peptidase II